MFLSILNECPLFRDIEGEQLTLLLNCLAAKTQAYKRDAFIFRAEERAIYIGIVLSGAANVIQEDFWGNRTILSRAEPGELFGESFSCAEVQTLPVSVVATEASEIMLIDYRKVISTCPSSCDFHARLISNMLQILARKNVMLTRKMEHLSKRTTREKLLSFLSAQAFHAHSDEVLIPFNRQELADYLCVERSALSRELSAMKREGVLSYEKNRFKLL